MAKSLRISTSGRRGRNAKNGKRTVLVSRARGDRVLAQGMARSVSKPFGGRGNGRVGLEGWDAFSPAHLPLPRAVGPYAVTKTTALIKSSAKLIMFGTFEHDNSGQHRKQWSNICALSSVAKATSINGSDNTRVHTVPIPGLSLDGSGLSAVPAAISVQLMNPQALQSSKGIVAGSVSTTQLDLRGRTESWNDFATEYVSYMRPRIMSAGKLALRGVQLDSMPLNMTDVSDFRPIVDKSDLDTLTWEEASGVGPRGFAPLVIVNEQDGEGSDPLELEFMVTMEWRTRFDIGNPAVASHVHHGVTSDAHWNNLLAQAQARGHGVCDIVEKVANAGSAVANAVGRGALAYSAMAGRAPLALAG